MCPPYVFTHLGVHGGDIVAGAIAIYRCVPRKCASLHGYILSISYIHSSVAMHTGSWSHGNACRKLLLAYVIGTHENVHKCACADTVENVRQFAYRQIQSWWRFLRKFLPGDILIVLLAASSAMAPLCHQYRYATDHAQIPGLQCSSLNAVQNLNRSGFLSSRSLQRDTNPHRSAVFN